MGETQIYAAGGALPIQATLQKNSLLRHGLDVLCTDLVLNCFEIFFLKKHSTKRKERLWREEGVTSGIYMRYF